MDHKWGRDVLRYGVGGGGATLVSRYRLLASLYLTNERAPEFSDAVVVWYFPYLGTDLYLRGILDVTGKGNFPYGEDVEPDEPL